MMAFGDRIQARTQLFHLRDGKVSEEMEREVNALHRVDPDPFAQRIEPVERPLQAAAECW